MTGSLRFKTFFCNDILAVSSPALLFLRKIIIQNIVNNNRCTMALQIADQFLNFTKLNSNIVAFSAYSIVNSGALLIRFSLVLYTRLLRVRCKGKGRCPQ